MKHSFITGLLLVSSFGVFAQQQEALIKGTIVSSATQKPLADVRVIIPELKLEATTDGEGLFTFSNVHYGTYHLVAAVNFIHSDTVGINVNKDVVEVNTIAVAIDEAATSKESQQLPTIALEESVINADADGVSDQSISGALTASRDPVFICSCLYIRTIKISTKRL